MAGQDPPAHYMSTLALSVIGLLVASLVIPALKEAFTNPLDKHFDE